MKDNNTDITFVSLLTLLFIGLKLGHVIQWGWLWVLSPIWISSGLFLVIMSIILIFVALFR